MIDRLNQALADRYLVERELGEGGMAIVFLAEDLRHHRPVALKVLRPELAAVIGAERFLSEIETTARLQHPNILPLFDSGEASGFLFYVMPYVEGVSLRDRLDREKQLPVPEAVRIAREVAEALQSAHGHGVVHRDIKPANILLSHGRPLVADFGIALAVNAAGGRRLTETGLSLGTPHYMSPEQATGDQAVGPASDVYSLGCVLYEMLVGEPPYTGGTAQAILGKVITSDPTPVTAQRRSVPAHVDAVVSRALEKLPADRFASAADFANALGDEGFRHGSAGASAAAPARRVPALAGWAIAAVLAALWLPSFSQVEEPPAVRRLSLAWPEGARANEFLALAPDAAALVMVGADGVFVQRLDDGVRTPLSAIRGGGEVSVSPDGEMVAVPSGDGLYVVPLVGGAPRRVVPGRSLCCTRWGVDGVIYFTDVRDRGVYSVPSSGGDPHLVLPPDSTGRILSYYQPLPGGDRAIVASDAMPSNVEIVDTRTGRRVVLTEGARPFATDSGHLLFARAGGGIFAAPFDAEAMELTGSAVLMVEGVGLTTGDVDALYTYSASGDLVYWSVPEVEVEAVNDLVWVDRSGQVTSLDSTWTGTFESVELAPDHSKVAVTLGEGLQTEIWIKDLATGLARRLTNYRGMNRRPVWSPDGSRVAFISDRDGRRAAYVVPAEGIASPELLLEHPGEDVDEVAWSEEGDWLVYRTGTVPDNRDIYARRIRPDTATIVVSAQPDVDERAPVLSLNGRWLAYVSNETGNFEVWVRPFPDVQRGSRQISSDLGIEPAWSENGDEIFFRSRPGFTSLSVRAGDDFTPSSGRALFPNRLSVSNDLFRSYDHDAAQDRFLMIRHLREQEIQPELILIQNFLEEVKARVGG